jgi:membrane protease YdiL (CAAX protease family)
MGANTVERPALRRGWGVFEAFVALVVVVILMALLIRWLHSGVYFDTDFAVVLSYAVVWVPLLAACAYACFLRGSCSPVADLGLRFTWLDVLFGVGAGLLARVVASIVELVAYGRMSGLGVTFGDTVYDGWWVFGTLLAPVLIAPFVEELFFRGLVLRAVYLAIARVLPGPDAVPSATASATTPAPRRRTTATVVSVLASAILFAVLHITQVSNPTAGVVLGVSTLVFGLGSAAIAVFTGRVGGSIVAHVVFNGSLVLASLTLL